MTERRTDLTIKLPDRLPGLAGVTVRVDLPDLRRCCRNHVHDGLVVPGALKEQCGGTAEHAPAREVEAEVEAGELHVLPGREFPARSCSRNDWKKLKQ
jgi:hypothetical protein